MKCGQNKPAKGPNRIGGQRGRKKRWRNAQTPIRETSKKRKAKKGARL